MMSYIRKVFAGFLVVVLSVGIWACGDSSSGGQADASPTDDGSLDAGQGQDGGTDAMSDAAAQQDGSIFDPDHPGIRVVFNIGASLMLAQSVNFAAGAFVYTGREDLSPVPGPEPVPFETCEVQGPLYHSTCSGPDDCAPEQDCVPERDARGNPIEDSLHCETPRTPMDVGPFVVEGFASGPITMVYNASQHGGYTPEGTDGTLPDEEMVFDTVYTFHGDGDPNVGLGAFSGEVPMQPQLLLTQPPLTDVGMGMRGIEVDETQDLVLNWDGQDPGAEVTISLSGATMGDENHVIVCRTHDSGTFTIPADMVAAAQLGESAFLNTLTIERKKQGHVTGEGITSSDIGSVQSLIVNVAKAH